LRVPPAEKEEKHSEAKKAIRNYRELEELFNL